MSLSVVHSGPAILYLSKNSLTERTNRNKEKTTGRRGHQFSSNSSISYKPRYECTSAGGSLAGPLSVNGDTKIPQLIVRYDSDSDCNEDYDESSTSDFLKDRFRRPGLEADKNFSDSAHCNFNHSDWRGIKSRGFNSLGRYPLKQLHARQIRQERSQLNLQNDADESDFRIYPSNLKTSFSKHLSDPESIYQSLLGMGHTSSKRSRQDHTQHEIVAISGSKTSHVQKHYMIDPSMHDEFLKTSIQVSSSSKNYRRNITGRGSPLETGNGIELEDEEQARSSGISSWPQKKSSSQQQIELRPSKDMASAPPSVEPRIIYGSVARLHQIHYRIDKRLTIIDEKSNAVLKYRTPHFRFINSEVVVMVITMMLMMMLIMMLLMVLALVFLLF